VNTAGAESDNSSVVTRTITAATAAKTVNITITGTNPPPTTATWKTIATRAYDVVIRNGVYTVGRQVGTVPLGTKCQTHYKVGADYYKVDAAYVRVTTKPRSNTIIARCAKS
jgi:hypothetical protein